MIYHHDRHVMENLEGFEFYKSSIIKKDTSELMMANRENTRYLIVKGNSTNQFQGDDIGLYRVCPLSSVNSRALRNLLPEYNPTPLKQDSISFGFGDRLGFATCGQLKSFNGNSIQPVIAQQSIRELKQTGRSYEEVLADAIWGAFQAGYHGIFTADGDHLKSLEEVDQAISAGYSMITIDCSEKIHPEVYSLSNELKIQEYRLLPRQITKHYESKYLNTKLPIGEINETELAECVLVYRDAIQFIKTVFDVYLSNRPNISYEISIDETEWPTTAFAHYFIASELIQFSNVRVDSIAPRFVGEFQKGIDYIGEISDFENHLSLHQGIAKQWGYKISIHSGSDKFSIFPSVTRITDRKYHIKTSGTSWVEFIRLLAVSNPEFFRELYHFCLEHLDEAKKSYVVSVTSSICPAIDKIDEMNYAESLDNNHIRQLFHITYGKILQHQEDGKYIYRDRIYQILNQEESKYHSIIQSHFEKHLRALNV